MPITLANRHLYPPQWGEISREAKERAGWKCAHPGCTAQQYAVGHWSLMPSGVWLWFQLWHEDSATYRQARQRAAEIHFERHGDGPVEAPSSQIIVIVLTTAHLDHDPTNCDPSNLAPYCQRHHLAYDAKHHAESAYMTRMAKRGNLELPL